MIEEKTKETNDSLKREKVRVIPIEYIDDFPDHPFQVKDDENMQQLIKSIEMNGVLNPIIARRKEDDRYELISGHRRKHACVALGLECIPIIVRELTRDEAVIEMVDSNLQREVILPSEKAKAYKMKMEAMKRQGNRTDLTSTPLAWKSETADKIGELSGESGDQVRRFIRLNELVPELLENVDVGKIAFRPAVELSYLTEDEQKDVSYCIDEYGATPSLAQAIRLKEKSREGNLELKTIEKIMQEDKPNQKEKLKVSMERVSKYF